MRKLLLAFGFIIATALTAHAQAINCPSGWTSSSSGTCGTSVNNGGANFWMSGHVPSVVGSAIEIMPPNTNHAGVSVIYQPQTINVQAFNTTFEFIPNGVNFSIFLENTNNVSGGNGPIFTNGAGCEADFYQGSGTNPNNVFALEFDQYDPLLDGAGQTFVYSTVQIYTSSASNNPVGVQCPCHSSVEACPTSPQPVPAIPKISTSPVPLNSPSNSPFTSTGDVYNANLVYDGSNLTLNLYDVTAGGTCTPVTSGSCFHNVWTSVDIPTSVDGNTAYLGFGAATGSAGGFIPSSQGAFIENWVYTVGTATATPTPTPTPTPTSTPTPTPTPTPTATPTPAKFGSGVRGGGGVW